MTLRTEWTVLWRLHIAGGLKPVPEQIKVATLANVELKGPSVTALRLFHGRNT